MTKGPTLRSLIQPWLKGERTLGVDLEGWNWESTFFLWPSTVSWSIFQALGSEKVKRLRAASASEKSSWRSRGRPSTWPAGAFFSAAPLERQTKRRHVAIVIALLNMGVPP